MERTERAFLPGVSFGLVECYIFCEKYGGRTFRRNEAEGNTFEEKVSRGNRAPKIPTKFPHTERGLSMYWHLKCRQVINIFIWMEAFAGG
jgi:hypothetical protein